MLVAFVHIPKTGGGSVKHWWNQFVADQHSMVTYMHKGLDDVLSYHCCQVDTSFTMVRNTYHRLVSLYVFAQAKAQRALIYDPNDIKALEMLNYHAQGIIPFLRWMQDISHDAVKSQMDYCKNVEHVIVDNNPEQWQIFCDRIGIKGMPERTHRVQNYDFLDFYDQNFQQWVHHNYTAEIDYFEFTPM